MANSGVDIVELGYKKAPKGALLSHCDEDELSKVLAPIMMQLQDVQAVQFAFMVDVLDFEPEVIPFQQDSIFTIARLAFYEHQLDAVADISDLLAKRGFDVWLNLMAVSTVDEKRLTAVLERVSMQNNIEGFYLVDSNGALYPKDVYTIGMQMNEKLGSLKKGIHTHNNLQLALANCLVANDLNFDIFDGSLMGLGRGGGNCPLELLMPSLKGAQLEHEALFEKIHQNIKDAEFQDGFDLTHTRQLKYKSLLTGIFNVHPTRGAKLQPLGTIYNSLMPQKEVL